MAGNNKMLEAIVSLAGQIDPSLQKAVAGAAKQLGTVKKAAVVAGTVTAAGMAAMTTATVAATKELYNLGVEFDSAVDTIRIGTGATGEALDALYSDMKEVYKDVPTTMEAASSAIADYNTRLGLTGEPLQELSKQAIQVSDMLGEDLSGTIEASSKAFQQWDIDAADMSDQMDYIFKVSQSTGTGFNVLMSDMQSYGAQLQELGFDFNQASVLIGQLDKAGVNVNEVLGAMKKSVSALAAEGISAAEGLDLYYTNIMNAKDATEATAIASEIFGTRAASTMVAAIRDGSLNVVDLTEALLASEETINSAATDTYDFAEQFQLLKQNAQVALEPIATEIFNLANEIMPYLQAAMDQILPIFSDFGETLIPILQDLADELFPVVTEALSEFGVIAQEFLPFVAETISQIASFAAMLLPLLMNIAIQIMPVIEDVLSVIFDVLAQIMPILSELITSVLPIVSQLITAIMPVITVLLSALSPIVSLIGQLVSVLLPPIISLFSALMPVIELVSNIIATSLVAAIQLLSPLIEGLIGLISGIADIFSSVFSGLVGVVAEPINSIIQLVNAAITAINGISITVPDWVPGLGGKTFGFSIPLIPMLAEGGFTDGISIAGEAGTEAVISFDAAYRDENLSYWAQAGNMLGIDNEILNSIPQLPAYATGGFTDGPSIAGEAGTEAVISFDAAYRDENLSYWAQAGRMLGVDDSFLDTIESNGNSGGDKIELNVTYAPNISINGTANDNVKNDVIAALKENEEDFRDMLEDMIRQMQGGKYSFG